MMQPLRIDFQMATHIRQPEHPVHFDGVLAWAAVQEGLEHGVPMEQAQENLPLAQEGAGSDAVWQASWIEFNSGPHDMYPLTRPFRVNDVVSDMGRSFHALRRNSWKGEISSSVNKAYILSHPIRQVDAARAWCIGDKDRIEYLLKKWITHLGKLTRLDFGRIANIQITEDEAANAQWKKRVLTWEQDGYYRSYETSRPPYWKRENRREVWVPSSV